MLDADKLSATRRALIRYLRGSADPDFQDYGRSLLEALERKNDGRFFWVLEDAMRLAGAFNARILDVGCGFGWHAIAMSLLGLNQVIANDVRPLMTDTIEAGVADLNAAGFEAQVSTMIGDVGDIDLEPGSLDVVFSHEAIEHVRDLDRMFEKCARALVPGGRCLLINDNNALNARDLRSAKEYWKNRDTSEEYMEFLRKKRPGENADMEPFAVMRERIVRRSNPDLRTPEVEAIVAGTAGLLEEQIADVAARWAPGVALPTPPPHAWCRNPVTGEYADRFLDPYEVLAQLERHGFTGTVRHHFRRRPLTWINGLQRRRLNRLLFNLQPGFVIAAHKR